MDFKKINYITQNFFYKSNVLKIDLVDSGIINETYIIEYLSNGKKSKFILQCLSDIFESYDILNRNHKLIKDHIKYKIKKYLIEFDCRRFEAPTLIRCDSNKLFLFPFDSYYWRAMVYIEDTFSYDILKDKSMAY